MRHSPLLTLCFDVLTVVLFKCILHIIPEVTVLRTSQRKKSPSTSLAYSIWSMGNEEMAGAYSSLGSTCSSSEHSHDIANLNDANEATTHSAFSSAERSTSRYATKTMLTPKEQRAVDELRAFLQHCLAQDYLLHVSSPPINDLGGHPLKLGSVPKAVHWRTGPGLFVSLQRCLEAKSLGESTFKLSLYSGFEYRLSTMIYRDMSTGQQRSWA